MTHPPPQGTAACGGLRLALMRGEAEEAGVLDDVAETRGRFSVLTEAEQREAIRIFKVRAPPQGGNRYL